MTVRIGEVTFSDWVSLPFEGGWTDTFIFHISPHACLPPFQYREPLRRMVFRTRRKRSSASIWVQVDAPGDWFAAEVRKSLHGLGLPFAVTRTGRRPDYLDFSFRPTQLYEPSKPPPSVEEAPELISAHEVKCLQALGRMKKGDEAEIAVLADLSVDETRSLLAELARKKWVEHKTTRRIMRDRTWPAPMDPRPLWHLKPKGLSLALRSWGVPPGIGFGSRLEDHLQQIGTRHRRIARMWPLWLQTAWPHAEIWTGWSEVRIPKFFVIPDGLAWGRIQGYETLFWLEVGDDHKSRDLITAATSKRLKKARELSQRTGVRLVYVQLSMKWVYETVRWASVNLPAEVAVVLGDWRRFGELPILEWGKVVGK
jgi:hypothetical protein